MTDALKLMAVLAHPDDESLGTGGSLAKYGSEGVQTYVVTATRGERGRYHDGTENPGPEAMGRIREQELLDYSILNSGTRAPLKRCQPFRKSTFS